MLVSRLGPVFDTRSRLQTTEANKASYLKQVQRSPDDEILLTELTFDTQDIIPYEINSIVLVAENEKHHGQFKCFLDSKTKVFFIEIPDEETMSIFTKSALMNMLKLAEEAGAETVYICVRKTVKEQRAYLKNFLFVGFEQLTEEEQRKVSMTKTHGILKYSLNSDDDDSDE